MFPVSSRSTVLFCLMINVDAAPICQGAPPTAVVHVIASNWIGMMMGTLETVLVLWLTCSVYRQAVVRSFKLVTMGGTGKTGNELMNHAVSRVLNGVLSTSSSSPRSKWLRIRYRGGKCIWILQFGVVHGIDKRSEKQA